MGGTAADSHGFPCAATELQPFLRRYAPGLPPLLQIVRLEVSRFGGWVKQRRQAEAGL